eukprot:GGOE01065121.1.p3 GENE.GGOE01065121.1~~GGOE01065121.1.p3  ORF type:complete len:101 (+),score=40.64 GGOE01065121.1:44-304(+)
MHPKVRTIYKSLLHLAKLHPTKDYVTVRDEIKKGFLRNKDLTTEKEIFKQLAFAKYIRKELEALVMLHKYRTLKKRYSEQREEEEQ